MLKGIRNAFTGMMRSIVGYRWAYADGGNMNGSSESSVRDSVWAIGGVEATAQAFSSLEVQFIKFGDQTIIDKPSKDQQEWINLFYNPNPILTTRQLFEVTSMIQDIDGTCFWVLLDEMGLPIAGFNDVPAQIMPFGKTNVKPKYREGSSIVIGWDMTDGANARTLPLHAVVRFWKTNPMSYKEGLSLHDKIGSSITLDKGARTVNRGFFDNGARPSGYVVATQKVGKTEFDIFIEQFRNIYGSKQNAGKVAALPHPFEFKPLNEVKDMDFQNLHTMTRDEQFGGTRVPKHYLGVNDSINYATAEVLDRNFWLLTIGSKAMMVADIINTRLLSGTGMEIKFSFEKVPIIAKDQIEVQKRKLQLAVYLYNLGYSTNEINQKLDLGMDEIKESWASEPHDPATMSPMVVSAGSDSSGSSESKTTESGKNIEPSRDVKKKITETKLVSDAVSKAIADSLSGFKIDDSAPETVPDKVPEIESPAEDTEEQILEKAMGGDFEAQAKYCDIVERATTLPLIPSMQKTIESYFHRLEKSQIARITAFIEGDNFKNKSQRAEGDPENVIGLDQVNQLLFNEMKWNAVIIEDTKGLHLKAYKSGIQRAKKELGNFVTFNESDSQAAQAALQITNKITRINETLRANVQAVMVENIKAGSTTPEIISAVKEQFEMSQNRANMIARTEMGTAANNGRWDAMSAEVDTKQWLTSEDGNVRESHRHYSEIGSQDVSYTYAPGLKFPQDSSGAAEEVINCRCTIVKGR